MPELPEVETVVQGLQLIQGSSVTAVNIYQPKLRFLIPNNFSDQLLSSEILSIDRRAKYILLNLQEQTLLIHLGMSGKLILKDTSYIRQKHDHVMIGLGNKQLVFNDPRRFGFMLITDAKQYLSHLGPEPLSDTFDCDYLYQRTRGKKRAIKLLIMDQVEVVGVGNIYACEALYTAGISSMRESGELTKQECQVLVFAIKKILSLAISQGGTTLKDYRTLENKLGYFQQTLQVYGQTNCPKGHPIKVIKQSGRSTHYCSVCQFK